MSIELELTNDRGDRMTFARDLDGNLVITTHMPPADRRQFIVDRSLRERLIETLGAL